MSADATFVALLMAHVHKNDEYKSWVKPHIVTTRAGKNCSNRMLYHNPDDDTAPPARLEPGRKYTVWIGGHWRRLALYGALNRALPCVCKFQPIV